MKQNNELKKKTSRFKIRNKKWISTGYLRQHYCISLNLIYLVTSNQRYTQKLEMLVFFNIKNSDDLESIGTNILCTILVLKVK